MATQNQTSDQPETVFTSKQMFEGGKPVGAPENKNEVRSFRRFETEPARVAFGANLKLNLGNYESAGVEVYVSLPCYVEEVEMTYDRAKEWVETRLQAEVEEIRGNKPSIF